MKRKIFLTLCFIMIVASTVYGGDNRVGLTLIPPGTITNKVDLDIRAGIVNQGLSSTYKCNFLGADNKQ